MSVKIKLGVVFYSKFLNRDFFREDKLLAVFWSGNMHMFIIVAVMVPLNNFSCCCMCI